MVKVMGKTFAQKGIISPLLLLTLATIGLLSYIFITQLIPFQDKREADLYPKEQSKAAVLVVNKNIGKCPENLSFYENSYFSLCYPKGATVQENLALASVSFATRQDILVATNSFAGGWGGNLCLEQEKANVSSYKITRVILKSSLQSGTCGGVKSYVSMFEQASTGKDSIYALLLRNQDANKEAFMAKEEYLNIEKSFVVK